MRIGYKIVRNKRDFSLAILKLEILGDVIDPKQYDYNNSASMNYYTFRKYRTDRVKVLEARDINNKVITDKTFEPISFSHVAFMYTVGEEAITYLNRCLNVDCASGIHYFKNVKDCHLFYIWNYRNVNSSETLKVYGSLKRLHKRQRVKLNNNDLTWLNEKLSNWRIT